MKKSFVSQAIQRAIRPVTAGAALLVASQAYAFNVTSAITGWWEQPNEQNHGLIISTAQLPDGSQTGVIFWAHYDAEGNPTWLLGEGDITAQAINADLYQVNGIDFMQPAGTLENAETRVGSLTITWSDCNTGEASFTTELAGIGSGSFNIARLTQLPGLECSGGITDDIPATNTAERFFLALDPASGFPNARGSAEWVLAGGAAELDIEIENVAIGEYSVIIGGINRGSFTTRRDDNDSDADGEIEFYSPKRGFNPLLDFDPRGQTLEVVFNGETVLSATLPSEGSSLGIDYDPIEGERVIRQVMTNTGTYPGGVAVAEWDQDDGYVNFEVDVDDIPAGRYTLLVDTIARGFIDVRQERDGDTDGEIEFYSPARPGFALLDFDPRGSLIEVIDGNTTLFFTEFGTTSSGDDSGGSDGGSGGGSNDDWTWSGSDREIRFRLANLGVYPLAHADVYYILDEDGLEFEVEIEDVRPGLYTLQVGGIERGTISAVNDSDGDSDGPFEAEGEIEFAERPDEPQERLLDFNVRGELIEVLEGSTVIFSGTFPNN